MKKFIALFFIIFVPFYCFSQVKVLSNGNVGIGLTTPTQPLHLRTNFPVFLLEDNDATGSYNAEMYLQFGRTTNDDRFAKIGIPASSSDLIISSGENASGGIRFLTNSTNKAYLDINGNFGIGDITPAAMLTVGSGDLFRVQSTGHVRSISGTAGSPTYSFTGETNLGMYRSGNNAIGFTVAGNERMRLESWGLRVNSNTDWAQTISIYANTSNTCGYHMYYGGENTFFVHASGYTWAKIAYYTSDSTAKKDIVTISSALDKIEQLRGVTFKNNYSDSMSVFNTGETYMGVIAQEIETVVPEVVKTMPDGKKAVAYQNLVGLLIEGIKEQNQKIEKLETDLAECCNPADGTEKSFINNQIDNDINSIKVNKNFLYQNVPNPFSKETRIRCFVNPDNANAAIYIFDMQGSLKKSITGLTKGENEVIISANEMQPGMYMYSLVVDGNEVDTKKMILTE
ncbi:MAG: tail fiber domain-containing protein [Bacteroidota bacterium]